jgi:hypothetical protein
MSPPMPEILVTITLRTARPGAVLVVDVPTLVQGAAHRLHRGDTSALDLLRINPVAVHQLATRLRRAPRGRRGRSRR